MPLSPESGRRRLQEMEPTAATVADRLLLVHEMYDSSRWLVSERQTSVLQAWIAACWPCSSEDNVSAECDFEIQTRATELDQKQCGKTQKKFRKLLLVTDLSCSRMHFEVRDFLAGLA